MLLLTSLGAALGVLYQGVSVLYDLLKLLEPFGDKTLYGLWFTGGLLAPYILQRPGAALLGETAAGAVSMFLGSRWGVDVLLSAVLQGAASEAVFAALGWKRFGLPWLMLAGAAAGAAAFVHDGLLWGYFRNTPGVVAGLGATIILSGALLGGGFAKLVGDGLLAAGALQNTALARSRHERRSA